MTIKFKTSELSGAMARVNQYVKPDCSYVLDLHKSKSKRSLNQNKYYWGVIISLFSQATGYTANEAHQELANIHLKYDKGGKMFTRSTAELSTIEFENYAEQCRLFMWHELNIQVPLPNEIDEQFLVQMQNIYNY